MSHRVRIAGAVALGVLVLGGVALSVVGLPGSDEEAAAPSGNGSTASSTTTPPLPTDAVEPTVGQEPVVDAPVEQTGGTVQVVLTYSGWDDDLRAAQVVGFVSGVIESGGTCTLTLTRGSAVLTSAVDATPDASTTSCGEVSIAGGALTPGAWTAVLDYASGTSAGSSTPVQIEVSGQ